MTSHMLQSCGRHIPRIHIFDVHCDLSIPRASEVRFSERTNYGLNPLHVNPDLHYGGMRKCVRSFLAAMKYSMCQMGPRQEACLRNVLNDVYAQYGSGRRIRVPWS